MHLHRALERISKDENNVVGCKSYTLSFLLKKFAARSLATWGFAVRHDSISRTNFCRVCGWMEL